MSAQVERDLAQRTLHEVKHAMAMAEAEREKAVRDMQIALQSEKSMLEVGNCPQLHSIWNWIAQHHQYHTLAFQCTATCFRCMYA